MSQVPTEAIQTTMASLPTGGATNLMGTIGSALQMANPYIAAANLGVGLLNLGVSAYTAYKVYKMDKKIDGISAGVGRIESGIGNLDNKLTGVAHLINASTQHLDHIIHRNTLMLGTIIENQGHLGLGIAQLHHDMIRGFRSIHDTIKSESARMEALELDRQMRLLFRYYGLCSEELKAGRPAPAEDLRDCIKAGSQLIAWLDSRIATIPIGSPERLPYIVARALAWRIEVDARTLLDQGAETRARECEAIQGVIRQELKAIAGRSSIYELAVGNRGIVDQYVFLYRAQESTATLVEFPDGKMLPFFPEKSAVWDDALGPVRDAFANNAGPAAPEIIELNTMNDHRGAQAILGMPRGSTARKVYRDDLYRAMRLPENTVMPETELRELLQVVPSAWTEAKKRINSEVN